LAFCTPPALSKLDSSNCFPFSISITLERHGISNTISQSSHATLLKASSTKRARKLVVQSDCPFEESFLFHIIINHHQSAEAASVIPMSFLATIPPFFDLALTSENN
jgi:hypothetical protein